MAVTACRKRHELSAALAGTRASLGTLVMEAEGLLSNADGPDPMARWQALSREARALTAILSAAARPEPDLEARLGAVDQAFAARAAARTEAAAKAQQDLVGRLQRLIDRTARAAEAETVTLREGDRLMRDIGLALDEATKSSSNRDEATKSSSNQRRGYEVVVKQTRAEPRPRRGRDPLARAAGRHRTARPRVA